MTEKSYFWKVVRNGLILSGIYLASVMATQEFCYESIKPILVFLIGYVSLELAHYYNIIIPNNIPRKKQTLVF
jgi:hypothetical protein